MNTYSEMLAFDTFIERFRYLKLEGTVGMETFGHHRYLNQLLYRSYEWEKVRAEVIARDLGNDLAMEGHRIHGRIVVHHIDPITEQDIINRDPKIFDPENLVVVTHNTHMAIHYGSEEMLLTDIPERRLGDTQLW